jgi:hypothetical protein
MADPGEIEIEIMQFLEKEENMRRSDKAQYLMAIINKHFAIDKFDHIMEHYDLERIVSEAKSSYAKTTMPMHISKKQVRPSDINYVLVLEAFVNYLNRNKLLKRLVKFDYGR